MKSMTSHPTQPQSKLPLPKWLSDFEISQGDFEEENIQTEFSKLVTDSSKYVDFKEGEIYKGVVVGMTDDYVSVDIGYKQEGLVYAKEFRSFDGSLKIKVGDQIEVYVERLESNLGNLVLSRDKAEIIKAWDRISEACEKGDRELSLQDRGVHTSALHPQRLDIQGQ